MNKILKENRFDFVSDRDKAFMIAFDDAISQLGYDFGGVIGDGYVWGRNMVIYRKSGAKSKKVYARIYLRDKGIALRLFLSNIDKHRDFIETSPHYIKEVFVGERDNCAHCHNEKHGICKFRKAYTLDGRFIEKCNGKTFTFENPSVKYITDYISLFTEFYPGRR